MKDRDLPRYVLVSDFARFRIYDLDLNETQEFSLNELHANVKRFAFIAGYQTHSFGQEDPINVKAVERLGKLHDQLKETGYFGHDLEVLLVRLLFCMFAEDTGLFERRQFADFIEQRSSEDGTDLGPQLGLIFQVLNTPPPKRHKTLDEQLASLPYVNGRLFEETLQLASFNAKMRDALLDCCALDWSRISPAIFGSLFQSITDKEERRKIGAHYTSESNILKALRPLLLDPLRAEFEKVKRNPKRLWEFRNKLGNIRILDPACGCGNFLVIAYRELRQLELDVLRELYKSKQLHLDVSQIAALDVDQFYGIEIEEFPAQIAQVALWLTDHQMNLRLSEEFGKYFFRLPLKKAPQIVHGNALSMDWREIVPPEKLTHITGNPPFIGAKFLDSRQKAEISEIFKGTPSSGLLDYVACWYRLAADYMEENKSISAAFVSTNSITQGEQVGVLWGDLLKRGVQIHFAHRTFQWSSEARGKAAVHCVIIGFALHEANGKIIFDYDAPDSEPSAISANNINPYLVDASNIVLTNRNAPLCDVPRIGIGNKPIDGGNYLFTENEKREFLEKEPQAAPFFRRWLGSEEFINGFHRWCLWLGDCPPEQLRKMPECKKRVEKVRRFRLASKSAPTRKLAERPTRFHVENMPDSSFLVIPEVSSEKRPYIPMGFVKPSTLCSNLVKIVAGASLYHLGVLSSTMHMSWVRAVCGRMKSDYRYSGGIVYNNYPWPTQSEKHLKTIKQAAQCVIDARERHKKAALADLYDPLTMPTDLQEAHRALDKAVDSAYGRTTFSNEAERVSYLFTLYQKLQSPLIPGEDKPNPKRRKA